MGFELLTVLPPLTSVSGIGSSYPMLNARQCIAVEASAAGESVGAQEPLFCEMIE